MAWLETKERIRRYFCTNQRKLHRRFLRYMAMTIFCLSLTTNVFHYLSWNDRYEMKRTAELSRKMLDARARIQITLVKTGDRRNAFTEDEKQQIKSLWRQAEYDLVEPNLFEK